MRRGHIFDDHVGGCQGAEGSRQGWPVGTPKTQRQKEGRLAAFGPAGTTVVLTIQRGTADPFDISIVRAKITVPQAEWRMEKNNIAYVHLYIYGDQTADQLHAALQELLPQKPVGIILDLRNNGGGFLTSAIDVSSLFAAWYQNPASHETGSQFSLTVPFTVGGNAATIASVTETLANSLGASSPFSANIR